MPAGAWTAEDRLPVPPPALLQAVSETCRRLADAASGRVFEVPGEGVESVLEAERASGERYDTILSFMRIPAVASLEDYIAAIERILAEEGWICMVEPAPTRSGSISSRVASRLRRGSSRRRADTNVVAAVRSHGLVVTDLYRREAPSVEPAWRQYVVLRARRETPRSGS